MCVLWLNAQRHHFCLTQEVDLDPDEFMSATCALNSGEPTRHLIEFEFAIQYVFYNVKYTLSSIHACRQHTFIYTCIQTHTHAHKTSVYYNNY